MLLPQCQETLVEELEDELFEQQLKNQELEMHLQEKSSEVQHLEVCVEHMREREERELKIPLLRVCLHSENGFVLWIVLQIDLGFRDGRTY